MPHFVPMTHLFTIIQLPSYLSGNQWFSFKLWVLLYRALQFHMQGRVGKCNTWTRLHDCLCIPSWWKLCPLLQPSLFSTNRIFFNLHHLNKNIENLLRHFCIQESRLKTKIGCCWGWGFQSALHRGKHGTASATQSHQHWVQLIAAAIWNLGTSCCIMVIWLSGNSRNSIPW